MGEIFFHHVFMQQHMPRRRNVLSPTVRADLIAFQRSKRREKMLADLRKLGTMPSARPAMLSTKALTKFKIHDEFPTPKTRSKRRSRRSPRTPARRSPRTPATRSPKN